MATDESKPWWMSKAVWGTIIGFGVLIASRFGIEGLEAEKENLVDWVVSVAGAVAAALAIYGRLKASQKLTK